MSKDNNILPRTLWCGMCKISVKPIDEQRKAISEKSDVWKCPDCGIILKECVPIKIATQKEVKQ